MSESEPQKPNIFVTPRAQEQWSLILNNDFTIAHPYLRIHIDGKGCDGFTYAVGFAKKDKDDLVIPVRPDLNLTLIMDPFSAFYLAEATLDYIQDFAGNQEGFLVLNHNQKNYEGKFWVEDESKIFSSPLR